MLRVFVVVADSYLIYIRILKDYFVYGFSMLYVIYDKTKRIKKKRRRRGIESEGERWNAFIDRRDKKENRKAVIRRRINDFYVWQRKEIHDILHDCLLANEIDISDSELKIVVTGLPKLVRNLQTRLN